MLREIVTLKSLQSNGKDLYTMYFEGMDDMTDPDKFGMELLLNLGNFSNLKMIAKSSQEEAKVAGEEIVEDILELKRHFLNNSSELMKLPM